MTEAREQNFIFPNAYLMKNTKNYSNNNCANSSELYSCCFFKNPPVLLLKCMTKAEDYSILSVFLTCDDLGHINKRVFLITLVNVKLA